MYHLVTCGIPPSGRRDAYDFHGGIHGHCRIEASGPSVRWIAKKLGIHRKTVNKYLESNSFPAYTQITAKPSVLDPYHQAIRDFLEEDDYQATWIFERLKRMGYRRPSWAGEYLDSWCRRTMLSRLRPMKAVARMLRSHRELILNWFRVKDDVSLGAVEGQNNKAKVTSKKAYGFRSYEVIKVALYHTVGKLPEPSGTHRFC